VPEEAVGVQVEPAAVLLALDHHDPAGPRSASGRCSRPSRGWPGRAGLPTPAALGERAAARCGVPRQRRAARRGSRRLSGTTAATPRRPRPAARPLQSGVGPARQSAARRQGQRPAPQPCARAACGSRQPARWPVGGDTRPGRRRRADRRWPALAPPPPAPARLTQGCRPGPDGGRDEPRAPSGRWPNHPARRGSTRSWSGEARRRRRARPPCRGGGQGARRYRGDGPRTFAGSPPAMLRPAAPGVPRRRRTTGRGLAVAGQVLLVVGGQLAGVIILPPYRELGDVGHHPAAASCLRWRQRTHLRCIAVLGKDCGLREAQDGD
jgi:hypothetical protein